MGTNESQIDLLERSFQQRGWRPEVSQERPEWLPPRVGEVGVSPPIPLPGVQKEVNLVSFGMI